MKLGVWSSPHALLLQQRLREGWARSPLKLFLLWWAGQLTACLPKSWQSCMQIPRAETKICWPILVHSNLTEARSITLILPRTEALITSVKLPWNAAYDLKSVVGYELDKYTPFNANQAHFDIILGTLVKGKPINLKLCVVERQRMEAILSGARAQGYVVSRVDVASSDGHSVGANLLEGDARDARQKHLSHLKLSIYALCILLAVCVGLSFLSNRQSQLEAMQQEVKGLRVSAQNVEAMRKKLQAREDVEATLRRSAPGENTAIALLDVLTRCLDTETWVEQLTVEANGEVRLAGFSRHASDLPTKLMECAGLEKPSFMGSVQADRRSGAERFTLVGQRRLNGRQL